MPRLEPGDLAPDFTLPDQDGTPVALAGLRGRRVVLFVYPSAMTPGCTKEACDFRDSLDPFGAAGYAVLGLSSDAPERNRRFADRDSLTYPLLSDVDKEVLTAYGAYGEKKLYGKVVTGVIRSTFVIDEQGRIEQARYNVRATGHVAMLARTLGIDLPA